MFDLTVLTGFVLLVLPCLIVPPIARWLSSLIEVRLGLAEYRRRAYSPATERTLEFLGFELYSRREYGAGAGTAPGELAGMVFGPGGGVGPVRMGMSPAQVEGVLGRSLGYDAWDEGNVNDSLIYDGVRLSFDRCDSRGPLHQSQLCVAEVRRADAVLFGRPLSGWGEAELLEELTRRGIRPRVQEPGYIECAAPYLAVWFEAGWLARVQTAA